MYSLINAGATRNVQRAKRRSFVTLRTSHLALLMSVVAITTLLSCSEKKVEGPKGFYNFDSLVNKQINTLTNSKVELNKLVAIDGKQEQTQFVPDSLQWANELEIFRQLDAVNKPSFRDYYAVNDVRDTNSNLMVREVKSEGGEFGSLMTKRRGSFAPVSILKLYYLRDPSDVRKIEAVWFEENTLYVNTRRMVMEFESRVLHHYRVEGVQKMVMDDSVRFIIEGQMMGDVLK